MTRPTSDQIAYLALIDPDASYRLAKRMERFKSNSVLGYRTAGSRAEFETGEMLLEEMRAIGLSDLRKDPFPVDGWEFRKARMQFTDDEDGEHYCELGGYQTNFGNVLPSLTPGAAPKPSFPGSTYAASWCSPISISGTTGGFPTRFIRLTCTAQPR